MDFERQKIFDISSDLQFTKTALELFSFQRNNNPIYKQYCDLLLGKKQPSKLEEIPFLPIQFFKTHEVKTNKFQPEVTYSSSGTTGNEQSFHSVKKKSWYLQVCKTAFELKYGPLKNFRIFALLPSYMERSGSSLIDMAQYFIEEGNTENSGFFLNHERKLQEALSKPFNGKTLLIGVTFALLDFAENCKLNLSDTIVMETGGMKGRRKEVIRPEVHRVLKNAFSVDSIHSEYGMTELLSQAYSLGSGIFDPPPWYRVLIRQTTDPFAYCLDGKTGGLNIIDLANVDSCAFIQTQDLGKTQSTGNFEVLGRFDDSDIRGCNLMVS